LKLTIRKIVVSGILGAVAILLGVTPLGLIAVPTPLAMPPFYTFRRSWEESSRDRLWACS